MSTHPDLASPAFRANPFPYYAELRQKAPIHWIKFADGKPACLILRYADVASALKDPRLAKNPFKTLTQEEQKRKLPWLPWFLKPLTHSISITRKKTVSDVHGLSGSLPDSLAGPHCDATARTPGAWRC